jgi:hypothetical protein
MTKFHVKKLVKQNAGFTRNPNSAKYFVSTCKENVASQKDWIKVVKELKTAAPRDIDIQKSQLLESRIDQSMAIIKIGDNQEIENEYIISKQFSQIKGFVKFVCYFTCEDDFREFFEGTRKQVCKNANGSSMRVIIMPYFPLGSIATYVWTRENIHVLKSCLAIACCSLIHAYVNKQLIHADFHAANILMKATTLSTVTFDDITIKTHGIRTWICDFEKSYKYNASNAGTAFADFIYDLQKLFFLLPTFLPYIDKISILQIPPIITSHLQTPQDALALRKKLVDAIEQFINL